ncbi:MAG TPA: alpha/beta hydrolase [Thermodesulfobacteriota bacterium]
MGTHTVRGAGGVDLRVHEWGRPGGAPILFVHGWSQSHLCWMKQRAGPLAERFRLVAPDLRGHGGSDAPLEAAQYVDGDLWADDVAAIIDRLALDRPILVAWSYGGLVVCDYLRKHGQDAIAGVDFVGGAVALGPGAFGSLIGPGFLDHAPGACDADLATSIAAIRRFLKACTAQPLAQDDFEVALAFTMAVRPQVRAFLLQREVDFAPVLARLTVPVLVSHGRADTLTLPAMADYITAHCRSARTSWYEGVGHAPFLEAPERFDRELARFATEARVSPSVPPDFS